VAASSEVVVSGVPLVLGGVALLSAVSLVRNGSAVRLRPTWVTAAYPRWVDRSRQVWLREVAPNLYVGGYQAVVVSDWDLVVSVGDDSTWVREEVAEQGVRHLSYPVEDEAPVPHRVFDAVVPEILEALPGEVLVHCTYGLSRSVSVAYAVLRVHGLCHAEAIRCVRGSSDFPWPAALTSAQEWAEGCGS